MFCVAPEPGERRVHTMPPPPPARVPIKIAVRPRCRPLPKTKIALGDLSCSLAQRCRPALGAGAPTAHRSPSGVGFSSGGNLASRWMLSHELSKRPGTQISRHA
eukprot:3651767-Prymnesium_polylepis.2